MATPCDTITIITPQKMLKSRAAESIWGGRPCRQGSEAFAGNLVEEKRLKFNPMAESKRWTRSTVCGSPCLNKTWGLKSNFKQKTWSILILMLYLRIYKGSEKRTHRLKWSNLNDHGRNTLLPCAFKCRCFVQESTQSNASMRTWVCCGHKELFPRWTKPDCHPRLQY